MYPVKGNMESDDYNEKLSHYYQTPSLSNNLVKLEVPLAHGFPIPDNIKEPLFPNHKPFHIPHDAIFDLDRFSFNNVHIYENALFKYGFVIIRCGFEDPKSVFFKSLINHIGIPVTHNSKNDDCLWDIRYQKVGDETDLARSHGRQLFPMHTDASFEHNPPRFIKYIINL